MRVNLPDDLYDLLEKDAEFAGLSVDDLLRHRVALLDGVAPSDRLIVLSGDDRDRLEHLLGGGHLQSAADLLDKVARRARIRIGGIDLNFSAGQLEELQRRCERLGLSVEGETKRIVEKLSELFFDHVGV